MAIFFIADIWILVIPVLFVRHCYKVLPSTDILKSKLVLTTQSIIYSRLSFFFIMFVCINVYVYLFTYN